MTQVTMGQQGVCPAPLVLRKGVRPWGRELGFTVWPGASAMPTMATEAVPPPTRIPSTGLLRRIPWGTFKKGPVAVPRPHPDQTGRPSGTSKAPWGLLPRPAQRGSVEGTSRRAKADSVDSRWAGTER